MIFTSNSALWVWVAYAYVPPSGTSCGTCIYIIYVSWMHHAVPMIQDLCIEWSIGHAWPVGGGSGSALHFCTAKSKSNAVPGVHDDDDAQGARACSASYP